MNFELVEIKPLFPKGSAKMIDSSEESKCSMARVCVFLKSARGIMGALGKNDDNKCSFSMCYH